jgi:hypothetical protein
MGKKMGDSKSKLNEVASAVEKKAKESPVSSEPSPEAEESCKMCGSMVKKADPGKMAAFMKSNPFKK